MSNNSITLSRLLLTERNSLVRRVGRLVGSNHAEDVVQKLWLKVQAVRDDPPIVNPRAYLHRLAMNAAKDELRGAARRALETQAEIETVLWVEGDGPLPDELVLTQDLAKKISEAVERLPEPTRSIFSLNRFEGLTQREIASQFGVSTTIVERHIRRALRILAEIRNAA